MIGLALVVAAYMAEVVRGGLQAVPRGQYEAASALGIGMADFSVARTVVHADGVQNKRFEVAEAALDLFIDLYGSWVGNVALLLQPRGGLYVAGGIAVHLQARMQSPRFMAAAGDKGRMRGVVERTPVLLVTNSRLGVQGAIATGFAMS